MIFLIRLRAEANLTTAALPKLPPNTNELNPLPHHPTHETLAACSPASSLQLAECCCLPRSPWRGRFSFRWPYETRFRRTFYPPRSRLTRPRVGFCTWSLPTVAVWSQDGSVAVEVDCILEVQHMLDCHHLGIFILIHKTA